MLTNKTLAVLKALDSVKPYAQPEDALFADANIRLAMPLSHTEFRQILADLEQRRRVVSVQGEDGPKWKITDNGRARLAELI